MKWEELENAIRAMAPNSNEEFVLDEIPSDDQVDRLERKLNSRSEYVRKKEFTIMSTGSEKKVVVYRSNT